MGFLLALRWALVATAKHSKSNVDSDNAIIATVFAIALVMVIVFVELIREMKTKTGTAATGINGYNNEFEQ